MPGIALVALILAGAFALSQVMRHGNENVKRAAGWVIALGLIFGPWVVAVALNETGIGGLVKVLAVGYYLGLILFLSYLAEQEKKRKKGSRIRA